MCDKCQRWVHTDCADIQVRGDHSNKVVYKCLKCKIIHEPQNMTTKKRPPQPVRGGPKTAQKKSDVFLNSIDFFWQLKP